ncbi:Protein-L-isoaspartate O-methyltransferase [hydrothermal vent metagenome]|uniref:Protein-L-isoaspartate O-methyltransferase n=1 Tax=hydrothermal vent metagenome TaxID=652676 RepID=A0A3B1C0T7_9ZZZZ
MAENNIEQARFNMVEQQIRPWDVLDAQVLQTFTEVQREAFVPEAYRNVAFADVEIPLDHGEQMMKPVVEARMLQALAVKSTDRILEIGTGSGFITACLAALGSQVISLDTRADFTEQAQARLKAQGVYNATVKTGDALVNPAENGSFDIITVTGSIPCKETIESLQAQLHDGGRMFVVTGEAPVMQACLITRTGAKQWTQEALFETELLPLSTAPATAAFTF